MSLDQSLAKVQADIQKGDLGKARDRLHGLVNTYPDDLDLRTRLGEIYWQLQQPEMAGRYWYLVEEKDDRMISAIQRFEKQFGSDPAYMLFAIRFRGDLAKIEDTYAGKTLLELHQRAGKKHFWYEDFRNRGLAKYHQFKAGSAKNAKRDGLIKLVLIISAILFLSCLIVGAITIINWIF